MTSPTTYKLGFPKLKYSVVPMASGAPFQRDPTTADLFDPKVGGYYNIGTIWPNEATGGVWILASISGGNTANWLGITDAASGNVDGPASATDNALARFDGTTGKLIQNSVGLLSDLGILTGVRPTLPAGTAVAGTAPMKFTLGVNLTVAEAGAVEYDGTSLFYTNNAAARQTLLHAPTLSSSVDNTLPKFDGTAWGIQDSGIVVSDTDVMSAFTAVLKAGTAAAGTAPLKFTLGVNLTSPEAGAVEYDGTHLTYTNSVPTRKTIAQGPASSTDLALAKYTGTAGEIQNSGTTLSASDVMTFPANGGTVYTAGTRKGQVTLAGGAATVATAAVAADSVIVLTIAALGTVTDPMPMLVTIDPGVDFDITSEDATDTSTINWAIVA
jgi:hypothetical protein